MIGGRCPLNPKIPRGGDDAGSKVPLPETVGDYPGGKRVFRVSDPVGELETPTHALRNKRAIEQISSKGRKCTGDRFFLHVVDIPTEVDRFIPWLGDVGYRKHARQWRIQSANLFYFGIDSRKGRRNEEAFEICDVRWPRMGDELEF